MCGIFAYINYLVKRKKRDVLGVLTSGLSRLEYRGYDSAGLCVDQTESKSIVVRKSGNVRALENELVELQKDSSFLDGEEEVSNHVGIAHTRWATHGAVCDINAHPQRSDPSCAFTVVHNGIITNFTEIRRYLTTKGFTFESETDTEALAVLAKHIYDTHAQASQDAAAETTAKLTFPALVVEIMDVIKGAYAIVFKSSAHFPGEVVACKCGSPLVGGVKRHGEGGSGAMIHVAHESEEEVKVGACEIFLASDTSAIVEHTKNVIFFEDDDVVHVQDGALHFYNSRRKDAAANASGSSSDPRSGAIHEANTNIEKRRITSRVLRETIVLELELEEISKGQYKHFMQKEIFEQPESVVNSMRGRINFETGVITMGAFHGVNKRTLRTARRIIFIACGTSLNACLAVRPLFDELGMLPVVVENASDFLDRQPPVFRDDVCVFVSQSGETADSLRALEYCKENGAVCVGFCNVVGSSISRQTHFGAHLNCGAEIGVASTKAFTSQMVTLVLIALTLCDDSILLQERRKQIVHGLACLQSHINEVLKATASTMQQIAQRLKTARSVIVLGRGYQYAICLEAALKIKELTYIHTEGINAGELKHGPLALVDEHLPVIIIATRDGVHTYDRTKSAVQQIKARKGYTIVLISEPDEEVRAVADELILVPQTVDCLQGIINVVPLQLLSYYLALERGNNVDFPRNLAKSVTTQ